MLKYTDKMVKNNIILIFLQI